MTVLDPQANEVFSIRTFKQFEGYRWVNTYELACNDDAATYADLVNAAMAICVRERGPLASSMRIYKVTISTYVPDSEPYNPSSFTTVNLDMRGEANFTVDTLPLAVCTFVRKNTIVGRPGKIFYRGFLSESDVAWGGDRFEILQRRINEIAGFLQGMLSAVRPMFRFVLARGAPTPDDVRDVIGITVVNRTTFKKMDNRYFDIRDN